jgi:hypothetical protein
MNDNQKTEKRVEKRQAKSRYGHVTLDQAKAAFESYGGSGCGEAVNGIKHRWARKRPTGQYSDYGWVLHTYDVPSRGAFPVTELDVSTTARAA